MKQDFSHLSDEQIEQELLIGRRVLKFQDARKHMLDFCHLMMPDTTDPNDVTKTEYDPAGHAKMLCDIVERFESGKSRRVAVSIPPQHGKPVLETELVMMGDGSRKELRNVCVGDYVITKYGRPRRVDAVHIQGELECVTIKTKSGRRVTAALDHPMLTPGGWVKAGDIRVGMSLVNVVAETFAELVVPSEKDLCAARLAGYFVGDGSCVLNGHTLSSTITVVDENEKKDIKYCCDVLGFKCVDNRSTSRARSVSISGGVRSWLRDIGLAGKTSHNKHVPDFIFKSSKLVVSHFLGAYFACDGSVNKKGKDRHGNQRKDCCVEYYSVSERLIDDVQHLLLRFGVQTTKGLKNGRYKGEVHKSWRLSVTSQDYVKRFIDSVPIFHSKSEILKEWGLFRTQCDNMHIVDPVTEILCNVRGKCRCLSIDEDKSFLANDFVVHNTLTLSQLGLAWIWGRNPRKNIVVVTYNQTRADELGHEFRQLVRDRPTFRQVFPEVEFQADAKSKSFMQNKKGGKIFFIGVGGTITGRTADYIIIDDPFKGDDDEFSEAYLERIWSWFFKVAYSRGSNKTKMCVIHCMTGDTPVLMGDGHEKQLKDLRIGDEVASYKDGQIISSKVLNLKNQGCDYLFTIRMKSGISVRANARHPFLVNENGEKKWLRTDQIKRGMYIQRVIGENGEVSNVQLMDVRKKQDVKACVILTTPKNDGQTDIDHQQQEIPNTDVKLIYDIGMELNSMTMKECSKNKVECARSVNNSLKKSKVTTPDGMENCSSIIVTEQEKLGDCSATTAICLSNRGIPPQFYGQRLNTLRVVDDEVVDVIQEGSEDVFDIQVADTENFIANGLVSHNTRWAEDDLIGRLCDPTHPERNKRFRGIADDWEFMNIPGVIRDERLASALGLKLSVPKDPRVIEQFGDKPCTALWPKEKSLEFFAQWKRGDARSFSALVMGSPTPEDGAYFTTDMIVEYSAPSEIPSNLRKYGASDHAVSEKQKRDKTVLGCVGIDEEDNIWILPDLVWDQMETDRTVEELLAKFRFHRPHCWWMESELISKSFGPFLRKRMVEERIYTLIDPMTPSKDKSTRARSIQGRMSMRKVFFPSFAPWFQDAKNQLLRFPYGANDDFVDWIAWVGLGLTKEIAAHSYKPAKSNIPKTGTAAWVVYASDQRKAQQNNISKGW